MENKPLEIDAGGLNFQWDLENGTFLFEKDDAVLFWISSAMKTFFDAIEEVSGDDAANLVIQAAGFRQGIVVGEYFQSMSLSIEAIVSALTNTYASAGWGRIVVDEISETDKTAVIRMKNSWEYKINKAQEKTRAGSFLPSHFAGLLSGLFGENIGYNILQSQIEGDDFCKFEYFPSTVTVDQNIHQLARRRETEEIEKLEKLVEERTKNLTDLISDISSPIIPVLEEIVVVPLLGQYDDLRSDELIEKTLHRLPHYQAKYLVLDLTALHQSLNNYAIDLIVKLAAAARLIGTETILVGMSAEISMQITEVKVKLSQYHCFQTLQHGIYYALSQQGRRIL
ncbi:STAS domain-containing protein [Bacillus canaveralius]|uniref:STAS domain-containing protein n=1 Tax=Bacillus canaveralius TaxID=1403243 RepID=UPI000F7A13D2|nr:STAS domain-containing protein [Bacillus canaveralius]RSK52932.1 STAS domain-containing protein [Bacillus canaveralius]